jgi:tetratricopeptide (TPR) repeat protein
MHSFAQLRTHRRCLWEVRRTTYDGLMRHRGSSSSRAARPRRPAASADKARPGSASPEARRGRLAVWAARGVIVAACLAAYGNSLHGPFVFDDDWSIINNRTIRQLWPIWPVLYPPGRGCTVQGRPLVNLSFAVNWAIGGTNVLGYHVLNVAVHLAAAMLLFELVRRTLLTPSLRPRYGPAATALAMVVAVLWAVHPLTTSAVTYVNQRAESMIAVLYLLVLYGVLRASESRSPWAWYGLSLAACWLGVATKEVIATVPVVALLYDRFFLTGSFGETFRKRWGLYAGLAPVPLVVLLIAVQLHGRDGTAGFGLGVSAWDYLNTQWGLIVHYLRLCFWPDRLQLDYGQNLTHGLSNIVPYAVGVLALASAVVWATLRGVRAAFLGLCFFILLAPSSSIMPITTEVGAEHRMYLPLMAVVALVVLGVYEAGLWLDAPAARSVTMRRRLAVGALASAVAVAGGLTWRTVLRNRQYFDPQAIWQDSLDQLPSNARAWDFLGTCQCNDFDRTHNPADLDRAIKSFDRSIELKPTENLSYANRGVCYLALGQTDRAIDDLSTTLADRILFPQVYRNRGLAYLQAGRPGLALADFDAGLKADPGFLPLLLHRGMAEYSLAVKFEQQDNPTKSRETLESALADLSRYISQDPTSPEAYQCRVNVYRKLGRLGEAIDDQNRVIALMPQNATVFVNRAILYAEANQLERAAADVQTARQKGAAVPEDLIDRIRQGTGTAP